MLGSVSATQWVIGWAVAGGVVLVVVLLVGTIIYLAAKIKAQALAILGALEEARDNTASLWDVQTTNALAEEVLGAARAARAALGG